MFKSVFISIAVAALFLTGSAQEKQSFASSDSIRDSLLRIEQSRNPIHQHPNLDSFWIPNPLQSSSSEIFRSDGASISEILKYKGLSLSVPFSLSSSMNRLMMYGNPAPVSRFNSQSGLLHFSRFEGSDYSSSTQSSFLTQGPGPSLTQETQPDALISPETVMFWENGVFDQNTLNLRFSRPLSKNLMLNMFSNYRYFAGKSFHHERNDVLQLYSVFNSDTSVFMNRGYNPLVNEHIAGGNLKWIGSDGSSWQTSFSYGDLSDEYALDRPAASINKLYWAKLNRYVYRAEASLENSKVGPLNFEANGGFNDENHRYFYPEMPSMVSHKEKAHKRDFFGTAQLSYPIDAVSSIGMRYSGAIRNSERFNGTEKRFYENDPELFYSRSITVGEIKGNARAAAGAFALSQVDSTVITPRAEVSASFQKGPHSLNLNLIQGTIPVYPNFDAFDFSPYNNHYRLASTELLLKGNRANLLLGYQYLQGIGEFAVENAWPEWKPPYRQPVHTLIIAPTTARWKGFSFSGKTLLSDSKPYVRASGALSHVIHPSGTREFIETQLALDYWSHRDPVSFGGFNVWSDPIYNLNLKITAHIRSFRLFYKVDNLLNLRQSYVPGYFSPGVTFRWGINWYLQR